MLKTIRKVEHTVQLPQIVYNNKHGVELVERNTFCSNCAEPHQDHTLRFPYMNLAIFLKENEYESFIERGIDDYTVDSFFDLFQNGYCLSRKGIRFMLLNSGNEDTVAVSRVEEDHILAIKYDLDKFKNIQDILNYGLADFEHDFNSGEFATDVIERH